MINWEVHTLLCSSQFAASPFVTILGCFVSFPLSYFVSAYLSSDTMILTRKDLDTEWAEVFRDCKNIRAAKEEILSIFSEEPGDGYVWSEQDIYEQMRKIISKYE